MRVAKFFEHGEDGAGVASAHVDATSFGFGGRGDDVFDSLAEDIEGAIDSVASFPAEVIVGCSSASSSRLDEVESR